MWRLLLRVCVPALVCMLLSAGCASSEVPLQTKDADITASVSAISTRVMLKEDLFSPFIVAIQAGTLVTWQNEDTTAHRFSTTPQQSAFLNPSAFSLTAPAGESVSLRLTRPGLYHYYESTVDSWNSTFQRVAASKALRHYPLAMDGVIWVQGSVGQLPRAAINAVIRGHDEFDKEFVAISAGGSVTWHNFDEDPHFLSSVNGWSPPLNPQALGLYRIAGTMDVPGGQGVTIAFSMPGLYYYYCLNHDMINPATSRAEALANASDYPIPMEGFVLVNAR